MILKNNLLTVIVPTRERPDTLKHCLRTIVAQDDPRMEIIVSDNCSAPETKAVFDSFDDSRLRYIRPKQRLGMSEHWEFALSHAKGDWVTVIGDDDGLMPSGIARFFALLKEYPEAKAVQSLNCGFEWAHAAENKDGRLLLMSGRGAEWRDSKTWLQKTLDGKAGYKDLPYLYTGSFIHRDVIQTIKEKTGGFFFNSITPDVYAGVAVASVTDRYLFLWQPLAIGGTSQHSNGTQQITKSTQDAAQLDFCKENEKQFHPSLGNGVIQSIPLMVYESFLQSAHLRETDLRHSLPEQLALTVLHAAKARQQDVITYCRNVAEMNALDFAEVERRLKKIRFQQKLSKVSRKILKFLPQKNALQKKSITGDPSLNNIYDAYEWAVKNANRLQL